MHKRHTNQHARIKPHLNLDWSTRKPKQWNNPCWVLNVLISQPSNLWSYIVTKKCFCTSLAGWCYQLYHSSTSCYVASTRNRNILNVKKFTSDSHKFATFEWVWTFLTNWQSKSSWPHKVNLRNWPFLVVDLSSCQFILTSLNYLSTNLWSSYNMAITVMMDSWPSCLNIIDPEVRRCPRASCGSTHRSAEPAVSAILMICYVIVQFPGTWNAEFQDKKC